MKQAYKNMEFRASSLAQIDVINSIISEYQQQGYVLTVRQLYYQLVARGHIENTENSYKRTTTLVNDGRLAGLIDWDAIEDRTREFITRSRWTSGRSIVEACAAQFHMDMWESQQYRVFVIVEKEALAGVLTGVCREFDVPLLAARGYPSGTVLREFSVQDLMDARDKKILILHLGDHDPSGIDMTRDLRERISMFTEYQLDMELRRIALNMPQVEEVNPPPNPAKTTDSRFADYLRQYGNESWELDALQPAYLTNLVRTHVSEVIDPDEWAAREDEIQYVRDRIRQVAADL